MRTVTLEEHFLTSDLQKATAKFLPENPALKATQEKLLELGGGRLAAMDAGGVDMQVLSVAALGLDKLDSASATSLMRGANDEPASAVEAYPARYAGFANVNLKDPAGAAGELERCVRKLGFKGAMLNGLTGEAFLDDARFRPVFEAAEALGVPLYLHPAPPPSAVFETYFSGLPPAISMPLSMAGWGWHVETGLHCLRLIVSGVLDRFPEQQIIIGHMGENLPFSLARAATVLGPATAHLERSIAEYFHQNFHVTTSGYFTQPPFLCTLQVVGADRLLYSVDYPFSSNEKGRAFLDAVPVSAADREKISHGNADKLLNLNS